VKWPYGESSYVSGEQRAENGEQIIDFSVHTLEEKLPYNRGFILK